jgi:diguanylate cyclase (GGDEF)-like protein
MGWEAIDPLRRLFEGIDLSTSIALSASGLATLVATAAWLRQRLAGRWLELRLRSARGEVEALRSNDPLTGLAAREEFEAATDAAAADCDRTGARLSVLYLGLDNFRTINEGYGHAAGDAVLAEAGARLRAIAGSGPRAARLAGDEFALLVQAGAEEASSVADRVLASLQRPFMAEGRALELGASIGMAVYPEHGSRQRLVGHAALAMRSAKAGGGSAYTRFHPSMAVDMREQAEMLQDLRHAVEGGQLQLVYQPKIDARSLQVTAAEALLRWQHPQRGLVCPSVFVPLAERHGLIASLGRWVIEEACRQAAAWRERGLRMRIAVNLSGHQLRQDDLVDHLLAALRRHGLPPGRMTCEITESMAMEDTRQTRAAFEHLRQAGLHVSIDDFGTGHSSLATLRRLPAAELKVDRAFVTDLESSEHARSIVRAVVQMAHTLGLRVVAEGVETAAQRDLLVGMGCDELQGYLFAKPMSALAITLWAASADAGEEPAFRASLFDITRPAELTP